MYRPPSNVRMGAAIEVALWQGIIRPTRGLHMSPIAWPGIPALTAAASRLAVRLRLLLPLLLAVGCASGQVTVPAEVSQAGIAARLLVAPDLDVKTAETFVKPGASDKASRAPAVETTTFALADAVAYALQNNPRLRSANAAIERARGQEQVEFAPFLPQIGLSNQTGVVSSTLAPGVPGAAGFILANGDVSRNYTETELQLQWTIYDFGRTGGRYRQAIARERIAELQRARAEQTVEFDVAAAYLDVLLARASRRVQEDAVRRAQATLDDTVAQRKGGVALKEDVLRADVQLSESREALVLAQEAEWNTAARLNNVMGRNAGLPLEVVDLDAQPPVPGTLAEMLEQSATQRPEISLVGQAVAAAQEGRQVAQAEFLPRIFVRGSVGHTDGDGVITGWQEGAGLHLESPLYTGGRLRGELRSAEASVQAALADTQTILDGISLQVNLAYRGVIAARQRIELSRTAVAQSEENLRLVRVRYRNGNATPTDIVDGEATLTRSQQRFFSSRYTYLAALARLDYAVGRRPGACFEKPDVIRSEELPRPFLMLEAN
jgi:outer membrane protein